MENERARLGATDATVERDQLLEGAPGLERCVIEAADHDVGHMGEAVRAQQVLGRVGRERCQWILALDPAVREVVGAAPAEHDRAVLG